MDINTQTTLDKIRRQYLQLVDPALLVWPDTNILKTPQVQLWLFENMFNIDKFSTAPPERYRLRVLKPLISKLEKAIEDPEEDVCHSLS